MRAGQEAAVASAKATRLFTDRSGATRASIATRSFGGLRGQVRAGGAATFLERGTGAHSIVAKGRTLRFQVGGQTLYRRMVRHPGTKPRPFMTEARDAAVAAIEVSTAVLFEHAIGRA